MTDRQRRALTRQLHVLAHHIGLTDWAFILDAEPCGGSHAATVSCVYGRRVAHVALAADWWSLDAGERHHVLVHELLHVVTDPIRTYLEETVPSLVGNIAWAAISEAVRQHEEHAVDQLATSLAPHLPVMEDV